MEKNDLIKEIVDKVLKEMADKKPISQDYEKISLTESDDFIDDICEYNLQDRVFLEKARDLEGLRKLKKSTPARIALGRTGPRYLTIPWLRFRADHAAAEDSVWSEINEDFVGQEGWISLRSVCKSKDEHISRPDLGKMLSDEGKELLKKQVKTGDTLVVVIAEGLSTRAIQINAPPLLTSLKKHLGLSNLGFSTPIFVRYGRTAVMNDIGEILKPDIVVELIGERPGLVTDRSMSVYLCYQPNKNTVESERSVVSNIHDGGVPAGEAGEVVAKLVKRVLEARASGVNLPA